MRKLGRVGVRFLGSPVQTLRSLPDLLESVRMKLRQDATFRLKRHVLHAASNCPAAMIDKAIEMWRPQSVLDVGCGTGRVLDYLASRGIVDLCGLEGSEIAICAAARPQWIRQIDLSKPVHLNRQFDLVYTVEVAEHIRPDAAVEFVRNCTRHGNRIVFTAARPGQGGLGHLNEQEPAYWIELFREEGFVVDEAGQNRLKAVGDQFSSNLLVFIRG